MTSEPEASDPVAGVEEEEVTRNKNKEHNRNRRTCSPSSSCSTQNSPSTATINLRREYTLALQTNSYNEIWDLIHHHHVETLEILQPNRASIDEILRSAPPTILTRIVSRYLNTSEQISDLFLSLRHSVDLAGEIYAPIIRLLDILPVPVTLSLPQCETLFTTFSDFNRHDNPFPSSAGFQEFRDCFSVLKQELDLRLVSARRRHRILRRTTTTAAACLVVLAAGAVAAVLLFASHALLAVAAVGPAACCCGGGDLLEGRRRQLRERMEEADAAARETYVLDNHLRTAERLVAKLHAAVESDMWLVRLGLEWGLGQIHPTQEEQFKLQASAYGS